MRRSASILAGALTLYIAVPSGLAFAHEPSPGFKRWTDSQLNQTPWTYSKYHFTAAVPGWLQTPVSATLKTNWASSSTNNSHGIRFKDDASGAGTVRYNNTASACPGTGWLGCADTNTGFDWDMWFQSSPTYGGNPVKWCQDPSNSSSTCWSVYRIGIHETSHVGGFLDDLNGMGENNTRMDSPPIGNGASQSVARCDLARLQMWYDVAFIFEDYPNCWHELADALPNGSLEVELSANLSTTLACYGDTVILKGRLWIHNYDSYKKIGGNNLASRTVNVFKGSTNIGFKFTDQTPDDAAANSNWSMSLTESGSATTTFTYHAEFNPLGNDNGPFSDVASDNVSITWARRPFCEA